jgi:hypothetical protein
MGLGNIDGFENYRRERERRRRMNDGASRPVAPGALRELQEVEAREERDRVLNRDVQEFFEAATRTAANIVQKVADNAKVEVQERLSQEMEEFLLESLNRFQHLVATVLGRANTGKSEELMEPSMRNLVGEALDEFRIAGTAAVNKHLGEDPQAADLDAVRREFSTKTGAPQAGDAAIVPVGAIGADAAAATPPSHAAAEPPTVDAHLAAEASQESHKGRKKPGKKGGKTEASSAMAQDLDRFMEALKSMVAQGKMTRDEAKVAWEARLASLDKKG